MIEEGEGRHEAAGMEASATSLSHTGKVKGSARQR